ncbi:hypothetical protein L7F22_029087 [Adiantum nelumboides]|nr:hypothetical protein [Adiantum nelumboides]
MDDYFLAAGTALENQAMLAMFCLTRDAILWWKQHCRDNPTSSPSWEKMKQVVKERYLPPAHQALKMNEFYALRQLVFTLEEYYSKFFSLRRYAPSMSTEQQIARFSQGLNRPLSTRLEAMRPTSIQDAVIRAKPLATELSPFPRAYNQFNNFWGRARRPINQKTPQRGNVAAAATIEHGLPNVTNGDISKIGVPKGKILESLSEPYLNPLEQIKGIIKEEEEMEVVAEEEEQELTQSAKPIDILSQSLQINLANDFDVNINEPYKIFQGRTVKEMEELRQDIQMHMELHRATPTHIEFWEAMMVACNCEIAGARKRDALNLAWVHRENW